MVQKRVNKKPIRMKIAAFPFILGDGTVYYYPIINLELPENPLNNLMLSLHKDNKVSLLFIMTLYYWSVPGREINSISDLKIYYRDLMRKRVDQLKKGINE